MCKFTILHYTQCNCNARDGNIGDGFIVTKDWHDRLLLDRDTVPFERCTQAKYFALSPNRSNTTEFSRCHNVKIRTIRFEGEACYRCLMFRRSEEKAERIRALVGEHKSFTARYRATRQSAAKDAGSTRNMWQSIKESPQFDRRTERQKFVGTKENLRSTKFGSVKEMVADWEDRLEKQIACRELAKENIAERKNEKASGKETMQEKARRQARMTSLQYCLAQANKRVAFPVAEEDERPPPEYEETEQNPRVREAPPRRLRIVRPARRSPPGTGPKLDVMVAAEIVQSVHESSSAQSISTSPDISSPDVTTAQSSGIPSANSVVVKYHTIGGDTAVKTKSLMKDVLVDAKSPPAVRSASLRGITPLSAEAPEFRPFPRPPPTEPRVMRVPTAPRAMREGSLGRTSWQPRHQFATYRGYSTVRGWRG